MHTERFTQSGIRSKEKVKLVGEDANGKKQWMKSGEFENIVNCYEIIKE